MLFAFVGASHETVLSTRRHPAHPASVLIIPPERKKKALWSYKCGCCNCSVVCHPLTELPGEEVDEVSEGRRQERAGKRPCVAHRVRVGAARSAVRPGRPFVVLLRQEKKNEKMKNATVYVCENLSGQSISALFTGEHGNSNRTGQFGVNTTNRIPSLCPVTASGYYNPLAIGVRGGLLLGPFTSAKLILL